MRIQKHFAKQLRHLGHQGAGRDVSLVPARLALGSSMVFHGMEKLRGTGPAEEGAFFDQVGIRPGKPWAVATGIAEVLSGALAIAGIITRPAALAVLVTQGVAVAKVHADKGFSNSKGGYEFSLALMGIAAALLLAGPGKLSAHERMHRRYEKKRRVFRGRREPLYMELLQ